MSKKLGLEKKIMEVRAKREAEEKRKMGIDGAATGAANVSGK